MSRRLVLVKRLVVSLALATSAWLVGGSSLAESAGEKDPGAKPTKSTCTLNVSSVPRGARVLLNGRLIGETPLHVRLPRSTRPKRLVVSKAGYHDASTRIMLNHDVVSVPVFHLQRAGTGKPPARLP